MPQEINIVRCYKCDMFQTQIVKKSKKWICAVCNEKQSMKRSFGQGSGKECRERVQQLNAMRQGAEELVDDSLTDEEISLGSIEEGSKVGLSWQDKDMMEGAEVSAVGGRPMSDEGSYGKKESKWTKYLDEVVSDES